MKKCVINFPDEIYKMKRKTMFKNVFLLYNSIFYDYIIWTQGNFLSFVTSFFKIIPKTLLTGIILLDLHSGFDMINPEIL